ncbi:MAG: hypothetical protein Salg2KO_15480 [Salibacteraceae bacterium]
MTVVLVIINAAGMVFSDDTERYTSPLLMTLFKIDFSQWNNWALILFNVILLSATIVYANRVIQAAGLIGRISNLPMLVLALLFGIIPISVNTPSTWLAALLTVGLIYWSYQVLNGKSTLVSVFSAALISGVISLLDSAYCVFFVIPLLTSLSANQLGLRCFFIAIIGFFLPWYFTLSLAYLFVPNRMWVIFSDPGWNYAYFSTVSGFKLLTVSVLAIFTVVAINTSARSTTLAERQRWQLILGVMAVGLLTFFIGGAQIVFAAILIPITLIFSKYFLSSAGKWMQNGVFITLAILMLIHLFI